MIDLNDSVKYFDASTQIKPLAIVVLSILYGSISFVCIAGNGLVLYSVSKNKRMKNITKYFINNLAIADMIIGFFVNPFQASIHFMLN
jgi:adrenergic receptor alpha-1B